MREEALGDRTFTFSGEVFSYRANVGYGVLREVSEITTDTSGSTVIDTLEQTVLDLIESKDGAHERFLAIVRNKDTDDPITFQDLNNLATWLIEAQVQTPTVAPSASTPGDASTSTESKASTSSQLAEASAA